MRQLSFKRHRFPADIIRHSIWLYARFRLSFRDVQEMLAERGLDVSFETARRWSHPFLRRFTYVPTFLPSPIFFASLLRLSAYFGATRG